MPQDDWGSCCENNLDSSTIKQHNKSPDFGDGLGHTQPGHGKDERYPVLFNTVTLQYSFNLDESTDVSNALLLLVFVRYRWSGILQEDMLFCGELPTRTTAQECPVLFMLIIDCSHRFKSLFQLFESLFEPIYLNII